MTRKIDIIVSLPGPAESLVPVIRDLRESFSCRIFGLEANTCYNGIGGSLEVFRHHFPDCLAFNDLGRDKISSLLTDEPPDLILLGAVNDLNGERDFPEKEILSIAKGLPVKTIQFIDNWFAWSTQADAADHFFLTDQMALRTARFFFPNHKNLHICGHPGLQHFYRDMAPFIPARQGPICYFTQVGVDAVETLSWLEMALDRHQTLLVKKHPRDKNDYSKILEKLGCPAQATTQSPEELFRFISCTVTHTSVVALKSALLGIPTINVTPQKIMLRAYDILHGYPLSLAGFSREVNSAAELATALKNPLIAEPGHIIDYFQLKDARNCFTAKLKAIIT